MSESSDFKLELSKLIINQVTSKKHKLSRKYLEDFNRVLSDTNKKEICSASENKEIYNLYLNYVSETQNFILLNE